MSLIFVTGNKDKFEEVRSILGIPLERSDIELPEIQSLDAKEVLRGKLNAAEKHARGEYIVEDTSLYLECLKGALPGPFIKWFEKGIGNEGIAKMAECMGDDRAEARALIGYLSASGEMRFFEGAVRGKIVAPRGNKDFGWGPIFQPEGYQKTFGEMDRAEKHAISMRGIAARKLKGFLESPVSSR
ncbi:MAG: non-canonical purine NTP pyrophosphatase [Minisyncoccia bacterium]